MNYKIYVIFHKNIFDRLYDPECLKNLVFLGVNEKIKKKFNRKRGYNVIYQYQLPYFNSSLETYKETSGIYHIYKNKLYQGLDYIGFIQYDMFIKKTVFQRIDDVLANRAGIAPLFYSQDLPQPLSRSLTDEAIDFFLDSYNRYFNASFTHQALQASAWVNTTFIFGSTFLIPVKIFEKMMPWISNLILQDNLHMRFSDHYGVYYNPAQLIERAFGLALAAEYIGGTLVPVSLPIISSPIHKILACRPYPYGLFMRFFEFTRPLRGRLRSRAYQWGAFGGRIARLMKRN